MTDEKDRTYTRDDTADSLENGKKSRGKIVENETNYWTVETCEESTKLTIELSSIKKRNNAKVSLLASYGGFPTGDALTDDYVKVDMNDSYFAKFELDDSGHLPLQPGELLYLTVQKMDTNITQRAIYDIVAKWNGNCDDEDPPDDSSRSAWPRPRVAPRSAWLRAASRAWSGACRLILRRHCWS